MIGFIGAAHAEGTLGADCKKYRNVRYAFLDDCNRVKFWYEGKSGDIAGIKGSTVVKDGTIVQVGGTDGGTGILDQVVFNSQGLQGLFRADPDDPDPMLPPQGEDLEELRPGTPDGSELFQATGGKSPRKALPESLGGYPSLAYGEHIYAVGGSLNGSPCNLVYRAGLVTATWYVPAGSFISRPFDIVADDPELVPGQLVILTGVSWTFSKTGTEMNDDWVMVRYRVAGEDCVWTCWTPRAPEEGSLPDEPRMYTYSSNICTAGVAEAFPCVNSVIFQEALIPDPFRHIQFEVTLYNDPGNDIPAPTLPRFNEFRIRYVPTDTERKVLQRVKGYPVPASDLVNLEFGVVDGGGEVVMRVYNVAGVLVAREEYRYVGGGLKAEVLPLDKFAQGVYIFVIEGTSKDGGPGLMVEDVEGVRKDPFYTAKGKFVVRRK